MAGSPTVLTSLGWTAHLVRDCSVLFLSRIDPFFLAAMRDFWLAKDQWYPSWPQDINDRALVMYVQLTISFFQMTEGVCSDSVKMWQQC